MFLKQNLKGYLLLAAYAGGYLQKQIWVFWISSNELVSMFRVNSIVGAAQTHMLQLDQVICCFLSFQWKFCRLFLKNADIMLVLGSISFCISALQREQLWEKPSLLDRVVRWWAAHCVLWKRKRWQWEFVRGWFQHWERGPRPGPLWLWRPGTGWALL